MAHVAKYQAGALGNMCGHFARWNGDLTKAATRDNIDPSRTHLNYNLAPEHPEGDIAFINKRIESLNLKRAPRKDAVRMCDCVVTLSEDVGGADYAFFDTVYDFLRCRYGDENVVSAWVHMDETTPHMHFAWVPITEDGRLSAKDVVNRQDLKTLHQDMQEFLNDTGLPIPVLLGDDKVAEKQLSHLKQDEYIAAKQKLANMAVEEKQAGERLERLRCSAEDKERDIAELDAAIEVETKRVQSATETLSESARALWTARSDGEREEVLRSDIEGVRERIRASESKKSSLTKQVGQLERDIPQAQSRNRDADKRNQELGAQLEAARSRNSNLRGRLSNIREALERIVLKAWGDISSELAYNLSSFTRKIIESIREQKVNARNPQYYGNGAVLIELLNELETPGRSDDFDEYIALPIENDEVFEQVTSALEQYDVPFSAGKDEMGYHISMPESEARENATKIERVAKAVRDHGSQIADAKKQVIEQSRRNSVSVPVYHHDQPARTPEKDVARGRSASRSYTRSSPSRGRSR